LGLSAFAGGLLRGPGSKNASTGWAKVLNSGKISQEGSAVRATWTLDATILTQLAMAEGGK
jgi:hypothetical protein